MDYLYQFIGHADALHWVFFFVLLSGGGVSFIGRFCEDLAKFSHRRDNI
jgi:hypothetical protein